MRGRKAGAVPPGGLRCQRLLWSHRSRQTARARVDLLVATRVKRFSAARDGGTTPTVRLRWQIGDVRITRVQEFAWSISSPWISRGGHGRSARAHPGSQPRNGDAYRLEEVNGR